MEEATKIKNTRTDYMRKGPDVDTASDGESEDGRDLRRQGDERMMQVKKV